MIDNSIKLSLFKDDELIWRRITNKDDIISEDGTYVVACMTTTFIMKCISFIKVSEQQGIMRANVNIMMGGT